MASPINAALCAMLATAFWSLLGYALARHLFPRALAMGAAPVLGWAAHSAAALPIFYLIGFSSIKVTVAGVLCVAAAAGSMRTRAAKGDAESTAAVPAWVFAAAAVLALVQAVAILPKFTANGVHLADAIFDHSKIAIVDAITRQGLPPINPVFGEFDAPGRLAYYYLWHFSAAELALPLGVSGWEADAGLTWFTAFASLSLMMGLAVRLAGASRAAIFVVLLATAASLRDTLDWIFDTLNVDSFLEDPTGFAGWLFQAAWVPQHLMSASCVVTAMLLIARCAQRPSVALSLTLALTVVAGFESSTHVGGVTFAIAALCAVPLLFAEIDRANRVRFIVGLAAAGVLAAGLIAPFVIDQLAAVAARGDSTPIVIHPYEVLSDVFPPLLRCILDLPAYWLIELPVEIPAAYVAGVIALIAALRSATPGQEKIILIALACLAGAGMVVSWLLASTLGDNNDLGLRAILPAVMILIAAAAAGMTRSSCRVAIMATALAGLILSLPGAVPMIGYNFEGDPAPDAKVFAQAPELWEAVRRNARPAERVANNPLFLQDLTPWSGNLSWALLGNRSSCFAGRELALAFAPLPTARREAINAQFIRVFAGDGEPEDVAAMAGVYGCDVIVLVPQDGAWNKDLFASSPDYRLAESREGRWRIYVRVATAQR
jgi:hypothetical protein